jgi:hypothetical protein
MGVQHIVRRGDSLWNLSGHYLGDSRRYEDIRSYHNHYVRLNGSRPEFFAIENPDLIYVGQILMIPRRGERVVPGTPKAPAPARRQTAPATALEVGVQYILNPNFTSEHCQGIKHVDMGPQYTLTTELSGCITLENLSPSRNSSDLELVLSEKNHTLDYKLRQGNDQAFMELVGSIQMSFDPLSNEVTVLPTLAAKVGRGPITFEVKQVGFNHFSAGIKLDAMKGDFVSHGRKFGFTADVSISAMSFCIMISIENNWKISGNLSKYLSESKSDPFLLRC